MYVPTVEAIPLHMSRNRISVCQFEPSVGDVEANLEHIRQTAQELTPSVAFAVFPELALTGYDLSVVPTTKTPVPGPITEQLREIARETGIDLVVGIPEAAGDDVYNSLVYVSASGVKASYRKRRLWGAEAEVFSVGAESVAVDTPVGRTGLLLCYDLNFPELALEYATATCDIIAVSAAWRKSFERDWRLLCRARALDQTCYVVGSNHSGSQSDRRHAGESLIVGPRGDTVANTTDNTLTVSAEIRSHALETARSKNPVRTSRRTNDT